MEVRHYDQSVCCVPVKISIGLADRAYKNTMPGINGCWVSLLTMNARKYRLRVGKKFFSQLLVLWWLQYKKDPEGQLSNACGDTTCVNPEHYRDYSDRCQRDWQQVAFGMLPSDDVDLELIQWGIDPEDGYSYQLHRYQSSQPKDSLDAAGMTRNFHCYHCNAVFDPLKSRNLVVCDGCWTDMDQYISERETE